MSSTPKLTKAQALRAFHAVVATLDEKLGYQGQLIAATKDATPTRQGTGDRQWYAGPVLCQDFEGWSSTTAWAVVWEDGDYEWVHLEAVQAAADRTVFSEPVNGFALGLYPKF